jgi:hypothetical protein
MREGDHRLHFYKDSWLVASKQRITKTCQSSLEDRDNNYIKNDSRISSIWFISLWPNLLQVFSLTITSGGLGAYMTSKL